MGNKWTLGYQAREGTLSWSYLDKSCSLCDFMDLTGFTIVQNSCPHMPYDIPQAKTGKLPCALGGQGYEQG